MKIEKVYSNPKITEQSHQNTPVRLLSVTMVKIVPLPHTFTNDLFHPNVLYSWKPFVELIFPYKEKQRKVRGMWDLVVVYHNWIFSLLTSVEPVTQ